jgi:hypothetical protein
MGPLADVPVCDQCGNAMLPRGPRAGITYSHVVGTDGKPLSDEPLPPSRRFCSKACLDLWDEREQP